MIINSSRLANFQRCNRLFYWTYRRRLEPKKRFLPLVSGVAIHVGLAQHYSGGDEPAVLEAMEAAYMAEVGAREKYLTQEWEEITAQLDQGRRMLVAYRRRYVDEEFAVVQPETSFLVTLGEYCYSCGNILASTSSFTNGLFCQCGAAIHGLAGRADLVVAVRGALAVLDHKTTKYGSASYMSRWATSFQMSGYVYGIAKSTGMNVRYYIVNVLKYLKTVGTPAEKGEPFLRQTYPATDIPAMITRANRVVHQIQTEDSLMKTNPAAAFPMNDNSCTFPRECAFIDMCWSGEERWWEQDTSEFDIKEADYVDSAETLIQEEIQ